MARSLYEAIVDGILGGGVYALMAVGLTLIFGVLDIINIAQGILVVLAAYLSYVLSVHLHIDPFVGLLVTVPAMFVIGVAVQVLFMRPLRGRERVSMSLLASYAVAIIIEGVLYTVFGPNTVQLNAWYVRSGVEILGGANPYYLSYIYLFGFGLAVVLVAAIYLLLYRTQFGRSVRATMQDQTAARLIGIDVNRVAALTFGIGVAVTAAGGMVFGALNAFNANSGYDLISRLLAIIILGGLGSIGGALAAAVFMITVEALVDIWSPQWSVVVFYAALVLVLTIRPAGLFGKREARAQ
jgi:branched-chain amino acid transport system permease protein